VLLIRRYTEGEESALFDVYYSAVHRVASRDYTPEQIQAWAPADLDPRIWMTTIREINPFVAELDGEVIGYADLQPNGYIDHFFVSGHYPRQGVGSQLMTHLLGEARAQSLRERQGCHAPKRANEAPCRLTTACSNPGWHKVRAPDRIAAGR
jgi:putative acetyltransferase